MREYQLIDATDKDPHCYLRPLGSQGKPTHILRFKDASEAHQYRLVLGLGTHPDPDKSPQAYKTTGENYGDIPILEVLEERVTQEEEYDPGCCQSGCPGCPWTEEQIRLGKL